MSHVGKRPLKLWPDIEAFRGYELPFAGNASLEEFGVFRGSETSCVKRTLLRVRKNHIDAKSNYTEVDVDDDQPSLL